jgi:phage terminase small subunit
MPRRYMTAKQERFCLLIVRGETAFNAYIQSGYAASTPGTGATNASQLLKQQKVSNRIAELREAAAIAASISVETLTRELLEIRADATADGQHGAAVSAVAMIAKLNGLVVDRKDISVTQHKPGWTANAVELSTEDWQRQFVKPHQLASPNAENGVAPGAPSAIERSESRALPIDQRSDRDHQARIVKLKKRMRKRARQSANDA